MGAIKKIHNHEADKIKRKKRKERSARLSGKRFSSLNAQQKEELLLLLLKRAEIVDEDGIVTL